jgi:hypothetical protein
VSAVAPAHAPRALPIPAGSRPVPASQPVPAARPRLRLVAPARSTVARLPFVLLVGSILAAGLLSLLMLHTLAAQDAFTVHDLQRQAAALADTEQQLAITDQQEQSPLRLAARAKGLGMVPGGPLSFSVVHGRLVGVQRSASTMTTAVVPPTTRAATKAGTTKAGTTKAGTTKATTTKATTTKATTTKATTTKAPAPQHTTAPAPSHG